MGALSPYHLLIVVIVLILLFGSSRLPDTARSLGRSMRIFKSEMSEMKRDSLPTSVGESPDQKNRTTDQNTT